MMKTKNNHFMKGQSITMQEMDDLRAALAGGQYKHENPPAAIRSVFYARRHRSRRESPRKLLAGFIHQRLTLLAAPL